jgi:hypothetical protein
MSIAWEENNTITTTETQEFSPDPIINRNIKTAVHGLQKSIQNYFLEFPTELASCRENAILFPSGDQTGPELNVPYQSSALILL